MCLVLYVNNPAFMHEHIVFACVGIVSLVVLGGTCYMYGRATSMMSDRSRHSLTVLYYVTCKLAVGAGLYVFLKDE